MFVTIQIEQDHADFDAICNLTKDARGAATNLANYFAALAGGVRRAMVTADIGPEAAVGKFTVAAGGSANNEECVVAGVTFVAKTSGATGNEFNISATAATQAANMAAAMAASSDLAGIFASIEAVGAEVIFTAHPGAAGNVIVLDEGDLANVTTTAMDDGADGTQVTLNFE